MIVELNKNHWRVSPLCWEKNYTDTALEVKDKRGHIVFQIRYLPDRVQMQGEWRDEFGNGIRVSSRGKNQGVDFDIWHDPKMEKQLESTIVPIFEYPSKEKWGKLLN